MSYVDDNLLKNEKVVHRSHLHWGIYFHWKAFLTLFIQPFIARRTSEFAVTNRRVIIKVGLFERRTLELNLSKIESIGIEQGFWGRLFGFGSIEVIGTGGTKEIFHRIAAPLEFRPAVQQASDIASELAPVAAPIQIAAAAETAEDRLLKARNMLEKGMISEEEYTQIRNRILQEM